MLPRLVSRNRERNCSGTVAVSFLSNIKKQKATILFPDGSAVAGYIHHSKAGWGEYYQIRVRNPYSGTGISKLKVGDVVRVEIYREGDKTRIELSNLK